VLGAVAYPRISEGAGYARNFFQEGGSTNSVEDKRAERKTGIWEQ
jgi:hypothetical protein